jgi:hypothetical protein
MKKNNSNLTDTERYIQHLQLIIRTLEKKLKDKENHIKFLMGNKHDTD